MNTKVTCTIFAVLSFAGCKASDLENAANKRLGTSSDDTSYNYLADGTESAASTTVSDSATIDSTVIGDIADARLDKMVARMMTDLDADSSASLSLEEYLAGPEKFATKVNDGRFAKLSDEQKQTMQARLQKEFETYSGEDALLSVDELKALLVAQAPRIADFRRGGHGRGKSFDGNRGQRPDGPVSQIGIDPNQGGQRPVPPSQDEIFKKFDTNSDGTLDQTEFKAMLNQRGFGPRSRPAPQGAQN